MKFISGWRTITEIEDTKIDMYVDETFIRVDMINNAYNFKVLSIRLLT